MHLIVDSLINNYHSDADSDSRWLLAYHTQFGNHLVSGYLIHLLQWAAELSCFRCLFNVCVTVRVCVFACMCVCGGVYDNKAKKSEFMEFHPPNTTS